MIEKDRYNMRWWAPYAFIGSILFILFLLVGSAHARPAKCGKYKTVVSTLKQRYNETLRYRAMSSNGDFVFETYASDKGTWTVMRVDRKLIACVMATGNQFKSMDGRGV